MPETMGIIAVRIPGGDLIDTLGQQVPQGMINIGGVPFIMDGSGKAFGEAKLAIDTRSKRAPKSDDKAPPSNRLVWYSQRGRKNVIVVE